jgi:hypothetical protein
MIEAYSTKQLQIEDVWQFLLLAQSGKTIVTKASVHHFAYLLYDNLRSPIYDLPQVRQKLWLALKCGIRVKIMGN